MLFHKAHILFLNINMSDFMHRETTETDMFSWSLTGEPGNTVPQGL